MALAALGGVAAGPVLGLYPGMDTEILIPAFIVIVIGGMGSLRGAFVGSLLIGIVDTFGKAYFPSLALFLIYLTMAFVLLIRPQGLFGIKYSGVSAAPAVTAVSAPATMQTRAAGPDRAGSRCWCFRSSFRTTRGRWSPRSTFLRSSP